MNQPPYILTDVFTEIVTHAKDKLVTQGVLAELNYQYGYVTELAQTLNQMKEPGFVEKKFPLIFLSQPFQIIRGSNGWFGETNGLRLFIITQTQKQYKAKDRMDNIFKPLLYKIYNQLLESICVHPAISVPSAQLIPHVLTDRYWWGVQQQSVLNDIVDCMELSEMELKVNNNKNCDSTVITG